MNKYPKVSVILPVYNGAPYVADAIIGILNQSFRDFEFIIIDDGSADGSADQIKEYSDPRIRFIQQKNHGLAATLNIGIGLAKGEYIARQDQDDIPLPRRLEKQVEFLDRQPNFGLLGTGARVTASGKGVDEIYQPATSDPLLRFDLVFNSPFVHSSVMMRKIVLDSVGGYATSPVRQPPEDYELWSRLQRVTQIANLPEVLQQYRRVPTSMTATGKVNMDTVVDIGKENITYLMGNEHAEASNDLIALYHNIWARLSDKPSLWQIIRQLCKLVKVIFHQAPRQVIFLIRRCGKVLLILVFHFWQYSHRKN